MVWLWCIWEFSSVFLCFRFTEFELIHLCQQFTLNVIQEHKSPWYDICGSSSFGFIKNKKWGKRIDITERCVLLSTWYCFNHNVTKLKKLGLWSKEGWQSYIWKSRETIQIDKTGEYHSKKDGNNECLYSQSTKEMGYEARCIWPCWVDTANTLLWINSLEEDNDQGKTNSNERNITGTTI